MFSVDFRSIPCEKKMNWITAETVILLLFNIQDYTTLKYTSPHATEFKARNNKRTIIVN